MMVDLIGNYEIVDFAYLQMKANANDPRAQFARAVLENTSYSEYLAAVGNIMVDVPGFKANPVTGRREILYFRRMGKIADAGRK